MSLDPAPVLVFITPARPRASLPSRPSALLDAFVASRSFHRVIAVHRLNPVRDLGRLRGLVALDPTPAARSGVGADREAIVHPWPFGQLERRFLVRQIRRLADGRPIVLWVADPKSAPILVDRALARDPVTRVFDAYDAWDLSPLVRGPFRRAAVRRGYAAATKSDLVFANTEAMADRFRRAGSLRVVLLPNGAPPVDRSFAPDRERPYVVYVGRIHERIDVSLLRAAAAVDRGVALRIAGPVERVPSGWAALIREPNVDVLGPLPPSQIRQLVGGAAAALVPHRVDDYTRSQDAMKAWEAIAVGTPVVSTSLPPVIGWPDGLAAVGDDPDTFAEGVAAALAGSFDATRELRFRYAEDNEWTARAALAIRCIADVIGQ